MEELPYLQCPKLARGAYGTWFKDLAIWSPYVAAVARAHGLADPGHIGTGLPGSHPVFVTDGGYTTKFYAPHWPNDGPNENLAYELLSGVGDHTLPRPSLLARGSLFPAGPSWSWPYIVMGSVPGRSLGELVETLTVPELGRTARQLGRMMRAVHEIDWRTSTAGMWLAERSQARQAEDLQESVARRQSAGALPGMDLRELDAYCRNAFLTSGAPVLVHGDLTADHVLLKPGPSGYQVTGLIDWADARITDPAFELVALYLDLFRGDPALLDAFRSAYGDGPLFASGWRQRATAFVLTFPFAMGHLLQNAILNWRSVKSPEALEAALWREGI